MATEKRLISVTDCPCDGCQAKPCGHPARCVKFTLWLNKTVDAVEVVRCKDCKDHNRCEVEDLLVYFDPTVEHYCCHGERRSENDSVLGFS